MVVILTPIVLMVVGIPGETTNHSEESPIILFFKGLRQRKEKRGLKDLWIIYVC